MIAREPDKLKHKLKIRDQYKYIYAIFGLDA